MYFETFSAEETQKIAYDFGQKAKSGNIFCLCGNLGAGKTVFAQGFAKGVGYEGNVTSPTFTIMNEYTGGRLPVYHFDLYRLEDLEDLESIGYEEYFFSDGVSIVEWPERADREIFPKNTIWITIDSAENSNFRSIAVANISRL